MRTKLGGSMHYRDDGPVDLASDPFARHAHATFGERVARHAWGAPPGRRRSLWALITAVLTRQAA